MSKNKDRLLEHDYDGIREYDNDLPRWWLWLFYITIIFAPVYAIWFHGGLAEHPQARLARQLTELENIKQSKVTMDSVAPTEEVLLALSKSPQALARGKEEFLGKCAPCHGQLGEGLIGPNLTDDYWIHGGKITDIYRTIEQGVIDKGMVPWKGVISDEEMLQTAAFVWTLHGTSPPSPKEPQGELAKRQ